MNLVAIEKLLANNKRIAQWYQSLQTGIKRAAAEHDNDYNYLQAVLQTVDYTSNDFYKFVCPTGAAKAFALACLEHMSKQSAEIEAEALRLFNEAVTTEKIGEKSSKKSKKDHASQQE